MPPIKTTSLPTGATIDCGESVNLALVMPPNPAESKRPKKGAGGGATAGTWPGAGGGISLGGGGGGATGAIPSTDGMLTAPGTPTAAGGGVV